MFITFEGGEGCGKSTHARLLMKHLVKRGLDVTLTREPGGTRLGRNLRKVLLKIGRLSSGITELMLFAADRAEHVEGVIKPALKARKIVLCDRYIDSTTAYQMGGRKLPGSLVSRMNDISSLGVAPDLTILLDIPPKLGIKRGTYNTKKDRFESENLDFHRRVRSAFLKVAGKERKRIRVISSLKPLKEVQDMIRRIVDEKL